MKIRSIYIKSFGKLKNLNLEFQDGLNIIYGSNESGKSTIQHFLKAMFYGMNSQKRAIADNERKRFIPWNDTRAGGQLIFQDENGKEYVIDRSFGTLKKEDNTTIYNFITGQEAVFLDNYQPGKEIFGLGEDAFEKTLFIKQLGAKVAMDKEDEIMKKLSNIQESGQEDLSYNKARIALENYKKSLRGSRKQGKLDILEDKIMTLRIEQQELEALHQSNIEDSKYLQESLKKIQILEHNLEQALKRKNEFKNSSLPSEEERKFKEKYFEGTIKEAEELIYKATEVYVIYKERYEAFKTSEEEGNKLKGLLDIELAELKHYEGFQGLEENIERKINTLAVEKKELEGILQQQSLLQDEVRALQGRIAYLNNELKEDGKLIDITTEEENNLIKLEERLQSLSHAIEAEQLKDNKEVKRDILKDKSSNFRFLMLAGFLMSLAMIYGGISKSLPAVIIGLVGLLTAIYGYSQYKKANSQLLALTKKASEEIELILKEKEEVEQKLMDLYNKYQVKSYMDLKTKLDGCRSTISTIEGIKGNILVKEKQLEKLKAIKAEEAIDKIEKYFLKIFSQCNCADLDDFFQGLKVYNDIQFTVFKLQDQYKNKKDEMEKKYETLTSAEKELKYYLSRFKTFDSTKDNNIVYYETFIENVKEVLESLRISQEEESKRLTNLIDCLDEEIASLNREITVGKEFKKDIEHKIETRFNNKRELWIVEEELEQCREQIAKLKKLYEASDIASNVLEEAFQEVQSNFIPSLNTEVANILAKVTAGKYNKVTVSPMNNYEIKVQHEESLRCLDFLSGGTFDQVYFSLRLALCNLIFKGKSIPVFLDDTFIQYDEHRLNNVMKFLQEYSKDHQVMIFTCRKLPLKETINLDMIQ